MPPKKKSVAAANNKKKQTTTSTATATAAAAGLVELQQKNRSYGDITYWDARYESHHLLASNHNTNAESSSSQSRKTTTSARNGSKKRSREDEEYAETDAGADENVHQKQTHSNNGSSSSTSEDITDDWLFSYADLKPLLSDAFEEIVADRRPKGKGKKKKMAAPKNKQEKMDVLDAGCGTSRVLIELRDDGHVGALHGVDLSAPGVRAAAQLGCGFVDGQTSAPTYESAPTYSGRLAESVRTLFVKPDDKAQVEKKTAHNDVQLSAVDVCDGLVNAFGAESFDVVLDKSTMDALLCAKEEEEGLDCVIRAAQQYGNVLRPLGKLLLCTWHGLPKSLYDDDSDDEEEEEEEEKKEEEEAGQGEDLAWLEAIRYGLGADSKWTYTVEAHKPSEQEEEDGSGSQQKEKKKMPWVYLFTKVPKSPDDEDDDLQLTVHEY